MESHRFDTLVKVLASRQPRRATLALLAVLGLGLTEGQAQGEGRVRSQADRNRHTRQGQCKPAGAKCIHNPKKGTNPTGKLCRKCCETFRKLNKKTGVCCIPNGQLCGTDAECCLGVCSVSLCQNEVIQLPPGEPPPTLPPAPGAPPCAAYAQPCNSAAECCLLLDGSPIPCSGGLCRFN